VAARRRGVPVRTLAAAVINYREILRGVLCGVVGFACGFALVALASVL